MNKKKAAVFVLLGQSNAVGHDVPMAEQDIIKEPLANVFGLTRKDNQSYDNDALIWSGYTSREMNLAEEQDDTYSVANCLADLWQKEIDSGNEADLPDLYIVQIAIGAQGVTEGNMWYPDRAPKLVPGKLWTVDISLHPFTVHILSLLHKSFEAMGVDYEMLGLHWRGGEEDNTASLEELKSVLKPIYKRMFAEYRAVIPAKTPIVIHRFAHFEKSKQIDPTGEHRKRFDYINHTFESLCEELEDVSLFDARRAPHYTEARKDSGIYKDDLIHYTPETNRWVASEIIRAYKESRKDK